MKERELKRKSIQDALDEQKSQKERNVMGQFSTPYLLAQDIMRYMRNLIGKDDVSLIEPGNRHGSFLFSLHRCVLCWWACPWL